MNRNLKTTAIALAAVALASCGGAEKQQAADAKGKADAERREIVRTLRLEPTQIERSITLSTTLQPYEKVALAPALQGRISKIKVEVGDRVQAGQLVAQMDEATYIQAKLAFQSLETDFERVSKLNESNNIPKQTYDQTKSQYDIQKASLENLERNTYLRAPFAGVVTSKNYEDGELFAGMAICELMQIRTLKTFVSVPETYFPMVRAGMPVRVTTDIYPGREFEGKVEIVYPTVDPATHTFQAQVRISNADEALRPGMYVDAGLAFGDVEAIIVPYQAVLKLQGSNERYVFLDRGGVAKRVAVRMGKRFDDQIEILSPEIAAGDHLVVVGQARLHDGSKLQVAAQ